MLAEVSLQLPTPHEPQRLVLLGHDHEAGAMPGIGAMQASEIYAFMRTQCLQLQPDFVRDENFVAPALLSSRLIYAQQLCDLGQLEQARPRLLARA